MDLKGALRLNAVFTGSCAVVCLGATAFVARHTGIPPIPWVAGLGLMLLSYVPVLLFAASRPFAWLVQTIILLDWGFVATATLYCIFAAPMIDSIGWALIGVPTCLVALFALLQQRCMASRTILP